MYDSPYLLFNQLNRSLVKRITKFRHNDWMLFGSRTSWIVNLILSCRDRWFEGSERPNMCVCQLPMIIKLPYRYRIQNIEDDRILFFYFFFVCFGGTWISIAAVPFDTTIMIEFLSLLLLAAMRKHFLQSIREIQTIGECSAKRQEKRLHNFHKLKFWHTSSFGSAIVEFLLKIRSSNDRNSQKNHTLNCGRRISDVWYCRRAFHFFGTEYIELRRTQGGRRQAEEFNECRRIAHMDRVLDEQIQFQHTISGFCVAFIFDGIEMGKYDVTKSEISNKGNVVPLSSAYGHNCAQNKNDVAHDICDRECAGHWKKGISFDFASLVRCVCDRKRVASYTYQAVFTSLNT